MTGSAVAAAFLRPGAVTARALFSHRPLPVRRPTRRRRAAEGLGARASKFLDLSCRARPHSLRPVVQRRGQPGLAPAQIGSVPGIGSVDGLVRGPEPAARDEPVDPDLRQRLARQVNLMRRVATRTRLSRRCPTAPPTRSDPGLEHVRAAPRGGAASTTPSTASCARTTPARPPRPAWSYGYRADGPAAVGPGRAAAGPRPGRGAPRRGGAGARRPPARTCAAAGCPSSSG